MKVQVLLTTLILPTLFSATALADKFICDSVDKDLRIELVQVTNFNGAYAGRLQIFDPNVTIANQLIASFDTLSGLLDKTGDAVVASVDSRHSDVLKAGKRVMGTQLNKIETIALEIDPSYEEPSSEGTWFSAEVALHTANGETLVQDFDCLRPF